MIKVYALIVVVGIVGIVGYGAKYYYDTTQNRIAILTKNNTKLKVAIETSEKSINELKTSITKMANLNKKLQENPYDPILGIDLLTNEHAPTIVFLPITTFSNIVTLAPI